MSKSNYLENKILDKVFRNVDFSVTGVYIKLHTADPGEDGTTAASAETTRKACTFATAASGGSIANTSAPEWTGWSVGTETITHVSLWDASTAGNCLWVGALTASKTIANGDAARFDAGSIVVSDD